ncbi:MAG: D-alanyl-D-alanine carboxypeptidase family protein [Myxococcota bacterium]|nr:D-alanyl-D-alanine carboxypeptidase family protein [Myxococcota bacterium]
MKEAGFDPGRANGTFSLRTELALRSYQEQNGLQVDGLAGQQTWGAFYGVQLPPGVDMLAGGGGAATAGGPGRGSRSGFSPGGVADSFDPVSGPRKTVTAYVNGSPQQIAVVSVGNGAYLRDDAAKAWQAMQTAASRDGINLSATSGFRSMAEQQSLYAQYQNGTGNLAAQPGYSNHQNGIAMDIGGVGGRGTAEDRWLLSNAQRFGFQNLPSEFWHYDYVG